MPLVSDMRFLLLFLSFLCASITAQVVNGCQADCTAMVANRRWVWDQVTITSSIVHATIVYVTNDDDGSIRTTTVFNELPNGMKPPPTNAAGTQTAKVTLETAKDEFTTIELVYPTELLKQDLEYEWTGVLPTYDAMKNFVCSTDSLGAAVQLVDFTAPIATRTTRTINPTDPGGLLYRVWNYGCREGALLSTVPAGNQNDAAISYCITSEAVCGAAAVQSVQFLTETSSSHESKSVTPSSSKPLAKAPGSSTPSRSAAPAALPSSSRAIPTVVAEPKVQSSRAAVSAPPTSTSKTRPSSEQAKPLVASASASISPKSPSSKEGAEIQAPSSTQPLGDAIAGGLGFTTGGSSSTSSSGTTTAQQFPGAAGSLLAPLWLLCISSTVLVLTHS